MLDVNRLRVIDAVARHESVTAAAKELHYSQPSVTHHLARLEAETGAQLLQRVGRGIRLTPAGQLLADRAAEIIGRIDAAGAELSAHVGLNAGRVRLAGFASANGSLVPEALATLANRQQSEAGSKTNRRGRGAASTTLLCNSMKSRNASLGFELGRGRALAEILGERRSVAEGVPTAAALEALAARLGVDMPIASTVAAVLSGGAPRDRFRSAP